MNYLTRYYKNLSEQLQEKVNFLQKVLTEAQNDPFTDPSQMTPEMIAAVAERNSNSRRPEEIDVNRTIDVSLYQNPEYVKNERDAYHRAISLKNELETENIKYGQNRYSKEQEEAKEKEKERIEQVRAKQENLENEELKNYPGYNPPSDPKQKEIYDRIFLQGMRRQQLMDFVGIEPQA